MFAVLRDGLKVPGTYASLAEAKAAGATVIAYGSFVTQVVQFVILAWIVFLMVKAINRLRRQHRRRLLRQLDMTDVVTAVPRIEL